MIDLISSFVASFTSLFIMIDPILSVPIFARLTQGLPQKIIQRQVIIAVGVAAILLYIFLVMNERFLNALGISIENFRVAGGIILLLLGIQEALAIEIGRPKGEITKGAIGVMIGSPLLCGPGAISLVIDQVTVYGYLIPFVNVTLVLIITFVMLTYASTIIRFLGQAGSDIMGRLLGLFLAGIAITLIRSGLV